ncbi:MAG: class I SAM-dependent DNA methyltransferase [Rhodothermaceae bacterium]|nr:class I SAM-dependent DNA methyltransferase [Rhodothermaceae bacterium]MYC04980.1 class I SAM-dependent DNA methyltransferase [Rhodothermaceae bacterium]MYI18038.1 class I SAM-dependent DNA methyltransferase [Rhodothermaceae bacterium]
MRLSWNEIRIRAAVFARDFADAHREKGETQTFYNEFFHIFGVRRQSVAVYEKQVAKLTGNTGFIDLFWKRVLLVEQKSTGRDLDAAKVQAEDYFLALKESERPRYLLVCDFQTFDLYDLVGDTNVRFKLKDLPDHVERFGFIMGVQKIAFKDQDPVNIRAAELVGELHDKLENAGFTGSDLEKFLVRIVFCLFADDTGVFGTRNLFLNWLEQRTSEDGHDLGAKLAELFQTLDTPEDERGALLDENINSFAYVNGELFNGATRIPAFNSEMREALIDACQFDWSPISPAIFGSLFQSVMNKEERRKMGAHYTTEKNIMKVIGPLFMDDLWAEFEKIRGLKRDKRKKLIELQEKLGRLTFFDPACGCGNFLIISYRELRRLEIDILSELISGDQRELDTIFLSKIDVDQFFGIEIGEFPAEIARTAMWMMDHIMNNELSQTFGQSYVRIPLKSSANIVCGDALEIDWADVIAPQGCHYVFGNPPFRGKSEMDKTQSEALSKVVQSAGSSSRVLDLVAGWFLKAGDYVNRTEGHVAIAFVSTNSITQGEQVSHLWPLLFERYGLEISFAHRTFGWGSDARGKAHVHVVIVGMVKENFSKMECSLFEYHDINAEPDHIQLKSISPYLFDAGKLQNPKLVVRSTRKSSKVVPKCLYGNKPADGGGLLLTADERDELLSKNPEFKPFVKRLIRAKDYLNDVYSYCLWLVDTPPQLIRAEPFVLSRLKRVKEFRLKSTKQQTRAASDYAQLFAEIRQPVENYIVIPRVTSERRQYVPFGFFTADNIVHDTCTCVPDGGLDLFAMMISSMHMCWMRYTCGRLKSDFRYASTLVYNTFSWPALDSKAKAKLTETGQTILDARTNHVGATLADLYDPDAMPPDLRKAHRTNDLAVDKLYRRKPFESERERIEFLFARYEQSYFPSAERKR